MQLNKQPTEQLNVWTSTFGKEYTDRHPATVAGMDEMYSRDFGGLTKTEIFKRFLGPKVLPEGRVLEVGCNTGMQLEILRTVNPKLEVFGVEPQSYAIEAGRKHNPKVNFVPGTGFDVPFKDGYFDAVMTNRVLIHIAPKDLPKIIDEMYRCSKRYIFIQEYFAKELTEVNYRGHEGLLWKTNFKQEFINAHPDLKLVDEDYLEYTEQNADTHLVDQVCVLEKSAK